MQATPLGYSDSKPLVALFATGVVLVGIAIAGSQSTATSASWSKELVGTYQGYVSEGGRDPITTTIRLDRSGSLVGDYRVEESGVSTYTGQLAQTSVTP